MPKKKDLLDSSDEEDITLTVNKQFAHKYEEKKKHEELSKLKDKLGNKTLKELEDESSSESEDEEGELLTSRIEDEFFRVIPLIQKKDPVLYDPKTKFFDDTEKGTTSASESEKESKKKKKKEKPLRVSDYIRNRILTKGPEAAAESDDDDEPLPKYGKSLAEEQDELKKAFWSSVNEMESGEDDKEEKFLKKRVVSKEEKAAQDAEFAAWAAKNEKKKKDKPVDEMKTLEQYWKVTPKLTQEDKFLRDYILHQRWLSKGGRDEDEVPTYDEVVNDQESVSVNDDEDAEAIEKAETFEAEYNFRHQEPDAFDILSYPRKLADSVRKTDDSRKKKRDSKKKRQEEEKQRKEEEVKRLKALKREELQKKLQQIHSTAGVKEAKALAEEDLEEDFDPAKFDQKMSALFNDDYYEGDDDEDKPVFGDDDELDNIEKESAATKILAKKAKEAPPPAAELNPADYDKFLNEYYKLDYEDLIAGQPVRFHYVKVKPRSYGLGVDQILSMGDKELNKLVGLKKLAPYREPLPTDEEQKPKKKRKNKHKHHNRAQKKAKHKGGDE